MGSVIRRKPSPLLASATCAQPRTSSAPSPSGPRRRCREIPARPSRAIHFFDPSNAKMAAKVPGHGRHGRRAARQPRGRDQGRQQGGRPRGPGRRSPRTTDFGPTQLWTRVNSLDSPVGARRPDHAGHRDRRQARRDHGARRCRAPRTSTTSTGCSPSSRPRPGSTGRSWCTRSSRPPAAWRTSRRSAAPRPRMQGLSLGPADLAADRRMKTTRVGGGHPGYLVRQDPRSGESTTSTPTPHDLPAGPVALHDRPDGRRLRDARDLPLLRPVRRHHRRGRVRGPVPQRLPARLRRHLEPAPQADRDRQQGLQPRPSRTSRTPAASSPRWATAPAR